MSRPRVITINGPTASGKSELALLLAKKLGGQIISADSMQVFRGMDIGTSKPSAQERRQVVHHQLDVVDPDQHYSAGAFKEDSHRIIHDLWQRKIPIIIAGGTGLYFRFCLYGVCDTPSVDEEVKSQVRAMHRQGLEVCWQRLRELDGPIAKTLHPNDTTRILRALEVVLSTGHSLLEFQQRHGFQQHHFEQLSLGVSRERQELYERINQRTHLMFQAGWAEEVEGLLQRFGKHAPGLKAIGYREIIEMLEGARPKQETIALIQQKTRNYAKRQITWFKKDKNIQWLEADEFDTCPGLVERFLST